MECEKLQEILEKHKRWLNNEPDGERANLRRADLSGADLIGANLSGADLSGADLIGANLSRANLSDANLRRADLSGADLRRADLRSADLRRADLSGAVGLPQAADYMASNFERTDIGYIAYKVFNRQFRSPKTWKIEPESVITENVNFDRCSACGCGINVAPLEWVKRRYGNDQFWKVLIRWEWLCGVCVPYNTDGKIRCERVELMEIV